MGTVSAEAIAGLKEMNEQVDTDDLRYLSSSSEELIDEMPVTVLVTRVIDGETYEYEYIQR